MLRLASLALLSVLSPITAALQCGNPAGTQTGLIPLTELDVYKGVPGKLYPGNSNEIPEPHRTHAITLANAIQPLNATGQPDPAGLIGMVSIGLSNCNHEFATFERQEDLNTARNSRVLILNGARGGASAEDIADPTDPYWSLLDERLAAANLDHRQVQVVWLKQALDPPAGLPDLGDAERLELLLGDIVRHLKTTFPRLQLCYLSSRTFGGYTDTLNGEPWAYESGFAVKGLIADQINGAPELNYGQLSGTIQAPLLLWGPYLWTDGVLPRQSDGLQWFEEDVQRDGYHPSACGEQKVADLLSGFFSSDETAVPWFMGSGASAPLAAIDASDDTSIRLGDPTPHGFELDLLAAQGSGGTYLRFDVSGITRPVRYAKLSLRSSSDSQIPDREVRLVSGTNWNEATAAGAGPNLVPPPVPGIVRLIPFQSRDGSVTADVTALVNADADGIVALALTSTFAMESPLRSKEDGEPPRLILIPE